MPEKPKSLVDEIMEMAENLKDRALRWGNAQMAQPLGSESRRAAASSTRECMAAIRSRLTAIESELAYFRKVRDLSRPTDQTFAPPRIESHSTLVNGQLSTESELIVKPVEQPSGNREAFGAFIERYAHDRERGIERFRRHFEQPSGLPCSSTIELGDEEGATGSSGICWDGEDGG